MKLDLTTLEKIRAEVERSKSAYSKFEVPFQAGHNQALSDLLTCLDTEIANAKNHD